MAVPTTFVLRYRGPGAAPGADVARIRDLAGVAVVDASSRMLLVQGVEAPLRRLVDELAEWVMAPDTSYPLPDSRVTVERPVEG